MKLKATLRLENGLEFQGWSFGSAQAVSGEVVFNTSMVGYPEQLTDATYSGQILCLTYPLIGNYGVPSEALMAEKLSLKLESDRIHPKGLIAFDVCEDYSNWEAEKSLQQWMVEQNLTGIYGIDTRELTKVLRDNGSMKGCIIPEGCCLVTAHAHLNQEAVNSQLFEYLNNESAALGGIGTYSSRHLLVVERRFALLIEEVDNPVVILTTLLFQRL